MENEKGSIDGAFAMKYSHKYKTVKIQNKFDNLVSSFESTLLNARRSISRENKKYCYKGLI